MPPIMIPSARDPRLPQAVAVRLGAHARSPRKQAGYSLDSGGLPRGGCRPKARQASTVRLGRLAETPPPTASFARPSRCRSSLVFPWQSGTYGEALAVMVRQEYGNVTHYGDNGQMTSKLIKHELSPGHIRREVVIDCLTFMRTVVALDLIGLTRVMVVLISVIFLFVVVKAGFARQTVALALVSILACITLGRWLIGIAIGVINGRIWADVAAGIFMLLFDIGVYNSLFYHSGQIADWPGATSATIYLNMSFLAYLICRITGRQKAVGQ